MIAFMRWIFALLLVVNVGFFAVMQLSQGKQDSDPMARHMPYQAERIRLMPEADPPQAQPVPEPAAPAQICLEWGFFTGQALGRAQDALKSLQLGKDAVTVRAAPEKTSKYWVYIPPLKSRAEAQKKQEELKSLGIEESMVMLDSNKWRNAISLGVFSTQEAADKYLAELRSKKNVKSAKSGPRTLEDGHASLVIQASGANLETDLVKLKQDFPGTELKAVPCSEAP